MTTLFAASYASNNARTQAEMKVVFETLRSVLAETLGGSAEVSKTLNSDAFTPDANACQIVLRSQAGAGTTDNCQTITATNCRDGQLLLLRNFASNEGITLVNGGGGAGQIFTQDAANFTLTDPKQFAIVKYNASLSSGSWEEVFRSYAGQKSAFRTYLGLGTAATVATGTTTGTLPLFENVWEKVSTYNAALFVASHATSNGQVLTARAIAATDLPTIPLNKGGLNFTSGSGAVKTLLVGAGSSTYKELVGSSAGQSVRVNGANNDLEFYTPGNSTPFTSTDQTITLAGLYGLAHGLASRPTNLWVALVCQTGELGYSANDVVYFSDPLNGGSCGVALWTDDSTNVRGRCNNNNIILTHRTTGAVGGTITTGNWKFRFYAL